MTNELSYIHTVENHLAGEKKNERTIDPCDNILTDET